MNQHLACLATLYENWHPFLSQDSKHHRKTVRLEYRFRPYQSSSHCLAALALSESQSLASQRRVSSYLHLEGLLELEN